jgi:hypothetical protein
LKLDIRYAELSDLTFIDYLQKRNAEDLSFYPKQVFEREIATERILLALVNNQHAGYLYHGSVALQKPIKIHQACIEYDLRGNWYGAGLVGALEDMGKLAQVHGISLRCGSDIAANLFWKLMGFECVAITEGGIRRMRDINTWFKTLNADLFSFNVKEPSVKKKDSSIWRKRGKDKKANRMLRGKSLLLYRRAILEEEA